MANIIVIGGENPVFIREELKKILLTFPENTKTIYYGDELITNAFFYDLKSGSLFCTQRLLVIKNAEKIKGDFEKNMIEYFKAPSDFVCLVLEYQQPIPAKILLATSGKKNIVIHNFKKSWPKDQKQYLKSRFDKQGVFVTSEVLELLIMLSGEDIQELSGMLDRLFVFLGDKKQLDECDIEFVFERAKNASIFQLLEAIFNHNMELALQSLSDLIYAGDTFPAINSMFYRATKIMWAIKTSKNGHIPPNFSVSPYEWNKYQQMSSKNTLYFLSNCLTCIQEIEISSKNDSNIVTQTVFERFLYCL